MVKCMVPDCRNYSNPIRKKVFHRLPVSNPVLCKRWLIAISNPAVDPDSPLDPRQARSMFVCSDHFLPTDYILLPRRPLLKSTAVPSVFPHRLHAMPGPVPEPSSADPYPQPSPTSHQPSTSPVPLSSIPIPQETQSSQPSSSCGPAHSFTSSDTSASSPETPQLLFSSPKGASASPAFVPPQSPQSRSGKKRKNRDQDQDDWFIAQKEQLEGRMLEVQKALDNAGEYSRFGQTVADMLRRVPEDNRGDAMFAVYRVLYEHTQKNPPN